MKLVLFLLVALLSVSAIAAENVLGKSDNSKKPIQIDADGLEVFQEQHKAIFSGNAIAKQGDMTIKSDKMTIYYANKDDKEQNKNAKSNSIKRVDVDGNVVLTSPGQNAHSQKGFYDTQKNLISLIGDVVLTKDNNILKGTKLDYFTTTGYSKIYSEPTQTNGGGRVRGLFVPSESEK